MSLLAMGPLAYIMVRIRCWACRGHGPGLSEGYSFGHCIWFVYGALMKQGSVLKPLAGILTTIQILSFVIVNSFERIRALF